MQIENAVRKLSPAPFAGAKTILTVLALTLLQGCSTPLPVVDFGGGRGEKDYETYKKRVHVTAQLSTFDAVREAVLAYYHLYDDESGKKRLEAQTSSEVTFYSSIVAILGGMAKSTGVVAAGGLGAAGAGLSSERYRTAVQAKNYELGASALLCMYRVLPGVSSTTLNSIYLYSPSIDWESSFRDALHGSLLRIRDHVRKLQTDFELGKPDVSKLRDAIKGSGDASSGGDLVRMMNADNNSALTIYQSKLKECEAAIGA